MSDQIVVSIICTCFNKQNWIRQALDSVAAQETDFPIEVIVVDDASTDGSILEIEAFRNEHPDIVRIIAHSVNCGISSTWIEACDMARGTYIARLDGDDFWTDRTKLQAQVDLLATSDDSKWCSTEFDIVGNDGNVIVAQALGSGFTTTVNSYEQMLAIKGLTNSSTWLVDAQLMREVNAELDPHSADDTFTLQLEMFQRTKLSRIMKPMCAMRIVDGSDSRPKTDGEIRKRFEGLRKQQYDSLAKHPDTDYQELTRLLIDHCTECEIRIEQINRHAERLDAKIEGLQAMIQSYEKSRNFIRPMKNAAHSLLPHKR